MVKSILFLDDLDTANDGLTILAGFVVNVVNKIGSYKFDTGRPRTDIELLRLSILHSSRKSWNAHRAGETKTT